jgi:hypothetical protein
MPDTEDVHRGVAHFEQDPVHATPFAVQELAQFAGEPLVFRGETTALGVVLRD